MHVDKQRLMHIWVSCLTFSAGALWATLNTNEIRTNIAKANHVSNPAFLQGMEKEMQLFKGRYRSWRWLWEVVWRQYPEVQSWVDAESQRWAVRREWRHAEPTRWRARLCCRFGEMQKAVGGPGAKEALCCITGVQSCSLAACYCLIFEMYTCIFAHPRAYRVFFFFLSPEKGM